MPCYKPHSGDLRLARLLARVGLGAKRAIERRIAGARLSYIQYELLVEVAGHARIHLREAARRAGWTRQVMAVAARDLARRGLLSIERGSPDARRVRLRLTEAGCGLLAELDPRFQQLDITIGRLAYPIPAAQLAAALDRLIGAGLFAATREHRWESEFR